MKQNRRTVPCYTCGAPFYLSIRDTRFLGTYRRVFCSVDCLVKDVLTPRRNGFFIQQMVENGILKKFEPQPNDNGFVCFSHRLGTHFRSYFEAMVAEVLVLRYGINLIYEPFELLLQIGRRDKVYVPDFFLPDSGVFIEVKGEWLHGSKKKFLSAVQFLGDNGIILIPPYLRKAFSDANKSTGGFDGGAAGIASVCETGLD